MDRKKYLRWGFCYSCILLCIQGVSEATWLVQLGQKEIAQTSLGSATSSQGTSEGQALISALFDQEQD